MRGRQELGTALNSLYESYNREESASDPVNLVRPFRRNDDREIAGFCAAALAFGRVGSVLNSIRTLFRIMGPRPAEFVRAFDPDAPHPELREMVHRWTKGVDLVALLWILRQMVEAKGSVENFFVEGYSTDDDDVSAALDSFSERALALDIRRAYKRVPRRPGVCYFFPRPSKGSACKRLNLYLRWMVRSDEIDLGVWTRVSAGKLIVPLDTHVIRLGRCLRLTRYRSPGWRMAADITASLRALNPDDPVRFDFSLCHVGMMNACGYGRQQGDSQCPLKRLVPAAAAPARQHPDVQPWSAAPTPVCELRTVCRRRRPIIDGSARSSARRENGRSSHLSNPRRVLRIGFCDACRARPSARLVMRPDGSLSDVGRRGSSCAPFSGEQCDGELQGAVRRVMGPHRPDQVATRSPAGACQVHGAMRPNSDTRDRQAGSRVAHGGRPLL